MGEKTYRFLLFLAGAVTGSAVTYKVIKNKYAQLAREEVDEVREYYNNKLAGKETYDEDPDEEEYEDQEEESSEYEEIIANEGYSEEPSNKKEIKNYDYEIIEPEEFGDIEGYDTIYLTYYTGDGYLADENDELVDNIEEKVGWDSLEQIGKYEDGFIHVRNYTLECDYEISIDERNYLDVVGNPEED